MAYNNKMINELFEKCALNKADIEKIFYLINNNKNQDDKDSSQNDVSKLEEDIKSLRAYNEEIYEKIKKISGQQEVHALSMSNRIEGFGNGMIVYAKKVMALHRLIRIGSFRFKRNRRIYRLKLASALVIIVAAISFVALRQTEKEKLYERHHAILVYLHYSDSTGRVDQTIDRYKKSETFRESVHSTVEAIEADIANQKKELLKELETLTN